MILDDNGEFELRFKTSPLPDPDFRRDLQRWSGQIGLSWARFFGAIVGDTVSIHFFQLPPPKGSSGYKGRYKLQLKENLK
jgi:hypothetical protein